MSKPTVSESAKKSSGSSRGGGLYPLKNASIVEAKGNVVTYEQLQKGFTVSMPAENVSNHYRYFISAVDKPYIFLTDLKFSSSPTEPVLIVVDSTMALQLAGLEVGLHWWLHTKGFPSSGTEFYTMGAPK